jgi:hypothetical protein
LKCALGGYTPSQVFEHQNFWKFGSVLNQPQALGHPHKCEISGVPITLRKWIPVPQCFAALNSSNRCDFVVLGTCLTIIMWDAFKSNLNESTAILSRDGLAPSPLSTSRVQISKVSQFVLRVSSMIQDIVSVLLR